MLRLRPAVASLVLALASVEAGAEVPGGASMASPLAEPVPRAATPGAPSSATSAEAPLAAPLPVRRAVERLRQDLVPKTEQAIQSATGKAVRVRIDYQSLAGARAENLAEGFEMRVLRPIVQSLEAIASEDQMSRDALAKGVGAVLVRHVPDQAEIAYGFEAGEAIVTLDVDKVFAALGTVDPRQLRRAIENNI